MHKLKQLLSLALFVGLMGAVGLQAECAKCKLLSAWGLASQPANLFKSDDIHRYEGKVLSVQEVAAASGVVEGVYVLLKTTEGNLAVRLGPAWYLKRQAFTVEPYDHLEVMASKVQTVNERPALVATKAKNGDKTIALRSAQGKEVWK